MKSRGHETIDHTADMGIRGWGDDIAAALEETAAAMFGLIADCAGLDPDRELDLSCEGNVPEELLVEFLNALLSLADIEEVVIASVSVNRVAHVEGRWTLSARARGAARSRAEGLLYTEVKAATYLGAAVKRSRSGRWEAQCVVDV